jgi:hypothetical protein
VVSGVRNRGCFGKLHNEEHQNLYSSPSIIYNEQVKENEKSRVCRTHGIEKKCNKVFVRNP